MLPVEDIIRLIFIGISQGCAYGLIALGFVLIYKATEVVNFAHGEFMMFGGFAVLTFSEGLGLGFWPGLLSACLAMGAAGYLIDSLIMRRIIGESQASVFILTVAFGFILRAAAGMIWGWNPLSLDTPFDGQVAIGDALVGVDRLAIITTTIVLCFALYLFFARSRVGIAMQASSQNQLAAYYMGIPVRRLTSFVWAIAAMIATIAGAVMAPVTQLETSVGFIGIKALAGSIVGGFGSIPGTLLGCMLIGVIEPFADYFFPSIKGVSAYIVMLLVLFVRPEGLVVQTFRKKA
ncbi:MAG: branched-chain amino acid ABC transporter permease [Woeseia sp.]|nr:branched-chain amino acid ABC transporter permease [Woeseia sp.]